MKCDIPVPLEKLIWFQKRLGLGEKELEPLNQYREFFHAKKSEFSENFYQHFYNILY